MSLLGELQTAVVERMLADESFNGKDGQPVAAIAENTGDVFTRIQAEMAKTGILAFVLTLNLQRVDTGGRCSCDVVVMVTENPTLNRGQGGGRNKTAIDIAEAAWGLLADWSAGDQWLEFYGVKIEFVPPDNKPLVTYRVTATTQTIVQTE